MTLEPEGTERNPILMIGHSLGGLIIKSALLHSDMARVGHLESQKSIKLSTYAVFFLGTPHQGGNGVSIAKFFTNAMSAVSFTNSKLWERMRPNSEWLQDLQYRYNTISQDFETTYFYEMYKMKVFGLGQILAVPKYSAVVFGSINSEDVGLAADHSTMVKYTGLRDGGFQKVGSRLKILAAKARSKVDHNWHLWDSQKNTYASPVRTHVERSKEFDIGMAFSSIRNPYFTGRGTTLLHLDHMLREPSQNMGFSLVVLYGAGGIGKTQIALEYAHRSRSEYASIFWIDGAREDTVDASMQSCLRELQRHYQIHDLSKSPRYKLIKHVLDTRGSMANNQTVRETFFKWLTYDDNHNWLMIIDNVDDLESVDFRTLLPSTQWGTILVTTRRSDLAVNWRSIEVHEMDQLEAMSLLKQSSKTNPEFGSDGM
ncbi:hypothetical protein QQZ08_008476 [Neonectria magnoliae]|uniref:NB-ARC domain-containing protein n=1 Tax=Neonectria magnoliae TaxID=2732573 RepID=A0ABR1HW48_9HYPO